jgi:hypothetical protein
VRAGRVGDPRGEGTIHGMWDSWRSKFVANCFARRTLIRQPRYR